MRADLELEQSLGTRVFKFLLPTQIPDFSQKNRNCYSHSYETLLNLYTSKHLLILRIFNDLNLQYFWNQDQIYFQFTLCI